MKKSYILPATFLFLNLLFFSQSCKSTNPNNNYKIIGKASNIESGRVFLAKLDLVTNKKLIVDSTSIFRGKFSFKGSVETPYLHSIFINDNKNGVPFFLENSRIQINFDTKDLEEVSVQGSREDSLFRKYSLDQIFEKDAGMEIMTSYSDYTFSAFTAYYQFQINEFSRDTMETIMEGFSDPVKESIYYKHLIELYESIKLSAPGEKAPNFRIPDIDGDETQLSDFYGKYLLLDFWASWCAPCRKENPEILKVFNHFKGRNFTILSISVDESRESWIKAIKDDRINEWNHASNLKGWDDISKLYGVRAIPQNFLIDPEGKIKAKNVSMEELSEILATSLSSE